MSAGNEHIIVLLVCELILIKDDIRISAFVRAFGPHRVYFSIL